MERSDDEHGGLRVPTLAGRRPRVHVAMPTFERLPYLQEAVASVLAQTYTDFSFHVSDNASTDGTCEWLASVEDERLTYSSHPTNVGWLANIDSCFDRIPPEAEYVVIFHDDDHMTPAYLQRTVVFLDANPQAGFVHTAFDVFGADGRTITSGVDWTHGLSGDVVEARRDFIAESMRWNCRVCTSSVLMRSAAIPAERYRPGDDPCPDFGLWLRMAVEWDAGYIGDPMIRCRVHGASASASDGIGDLAPEGYFFSPRMIDSLYHVKVRFLDEFGGGIRDADALRRVATSVYHAALIAVASRAGRPDASRMPRLGRLAEAVRREPRMAADWRTWRFVASTLAGPQVVDRVQTWRRRAADPQA